MSQSPDGAHLGMKAGDAMHAVLGGDESAELKPPTDFEQYILGAADDFNAPCPDGEDGYSEASRRLAKKMLTFMRANPESTELPLIRSGGIVDGEWIPDSRPDFTAAFEGSLSAEESEETGEMTGFMWGWAFNAARHICQLPPVENPAIVEIG